MQHIKVKAPKEVAVFPFRIEAHEKASLMRIHLTPKEKKGVSSRRELERVECSHRLCDSYPGISQIIQALQSTQAE